MGESTHSPRMVRFGIFEVDLRAGELRKQGSKIKLQEQPFQVLALLLEHPGDVVTREEIQHKLWSEDTFVDFEHSLNAAVKRLRETLGDSADNPRFVETLPRRGYRFIYPVEGRPAPPISPSPPAPAGGTFARRALPVAGAALAVVALLAVLIGLNVGGLRDKLLGRPARGEITSIAVLPLENLSGDPEQEYFVDGMTETLITELSKIGALTVISRQSVMQFKGTDKPLPEIARELNVDAVVEGSALQIGERVRITVQLIEAATDRTLWADNYDRELIDVLALHSEVAQAIAREIKITLTPQEKTRLASARHVSPEAYEDYLKGLYYWNRRTPQDKLKATQYFKEAIRKDPTYAPAYAGLADTYAWSFGRFALPPRELYPKARAVVLKALELDDRLAEAHTSLAFIKETYDWDWPGAEKEYRRAIELNPSYPSARAWYALSLALKGRFEEAFAEIKRAEELDPLSLPIKTQKGWLYFWAGQFDRAMEQWRKVVELDPNFPLAHYNLGLGYTQKGMYEEAIAAYQRAIALARSSGYLALLGHAYGKADQRAQAEKILAELNERAQREYISGFSMAVFYLGLDDKERALASLEKSYQDRDPNLPSLKLEPFWFDPLRSDPRFQSLLRRMNFPER